MSEHGTYYVQLSAAQRLEIQRQQQTEQARWNLKYAQDALARCRQEEYARFLPDDIAERESELQAVTLLVDNDPAEAAQRSRNALTRVHEALALARAAFHDFQVQERERARRLEEERRAARNELHRLSLDLLAELRDPVTRDFATDAALELARELRGLQPEPSTMPEIRRRTAERFEAIRREAETKASTWREQQASKVRTEVARSSLQAAAARLSQDSAPEGSALHAAKADLARLQERLSTGDVVPQDELERTVTEAVSRADDAVLDEKVRKATVVALKQALTKQGFAVDAPRRLAQGGDVVCLEGRRPAGAWASFGVSLDGGFTYRFEGYDGSACKTDVGQVEAMLQDVYGFKLSDKRTTWQNPDRLQKDARPRDGHDRGEHHGS